MPGIRNWYLYNYRIRSQNLGFVGISFFGFNFENSNFSNLGGEDMS